MTTTSVPTTCDDVMDQWVDAVRDKDWARLRPLYTDDSVLFDVIPPLLFEGHAVENGFVEWFEWYASALSYERTAVVTTADGALAVTRSLDHVGGTLVSGGRTDYWLRHTVVLAHGTGGWRIRHQHASVPVLLPDGDLTGGRVVLATP